MTTDSESFEQGSSDVASTEPVASKRRLGLEVGGEAILLLLCTGLFARFLYEASVRGWNTGAALMPRIVSTIGLILVVVRIVALWRRSAAQASSSQIMDIGFRTDKDADPAVVRGRFLRIGGFILVLYVAIWLIGFHVALPLGVALYLKKFGGVGWVGSAAAAAFFAAVIVGVYDRLMNLYWPDPYIFHLLGM